MRLFPFTSMKEFSCCPSPTGKAALGKMEWRAAVPVGPPGVPSTVAVPTPSLLHCWGCRDLEGWQLPSCIHHFVLAGNKRTAREEDAG